MQAVIEATGLHTRKNVERLIDPEVLAQALDNDVLAGVGSMSGDVRQGATR